MPGQDTNPADRSSDMNVELDNSWENARPSSSPSTVNRESDAHQETSASNTTNDNSFQLCQNIQLEDSSDWSHRLPSTSTPSPSWQSLTNDERGPATSTSNSTFRNYIYGGSSSSESESDDAQINCPVCFVSLLNREVATPDSCQHYFCCPCLKQWSTTVTTCPVDRRRFKLILVRNNIGGQVIRVDPVDPVSVQSLSDNDDDPTYCQVCHQSDREDRMLLCDYCDSGFHLECLNPPLAEVPDGDWFCSRCQLLDTRNTEQSQGRVTWVRVPTFPVGLGGRRVQCVRVPPVNRQVEEVISVSSDDESEVEVVTRSGRRVRRPSVSSNSDSARAQKKTPLQKEAVESTRTRRKKVTGRTPSLRRERSFSHTRRRRRRQNILERSPQNAEDSDEDGDVRTARKSGRSRLAENLGLVPCRRSNNSSTTHASAPASCLNRQRVSAGIPTLHLFGNDSLDYFSDGSDGEIGNEGGDSRVLCHRSRSSPTAARRLAARKLSQSLMSSTSRPRLNLNPRPSTSRDTTLSNRHNILDSIMESQGLWHSRNATVSLRRDGTITIKKASEMERPSEATSSGNNRPSSSTVTEPLDRNRERIQNDSNSQDLSPCLFTRRSTIGVVPVPDGGSDTFTSRAGGGSSNSRSLNFVGQQRNVNNRLPWESRTSNRISVTGNQARVSQVPLYPGNSNNSRSPGSSGSYHHKDSQYERSSGSSYQYSGQRYSSTHHSGFDSDRGHLGYSGYLGSENSSTTSDLTNSARFNLLPQFTVRRTHPHPSTSLSTSSTDERQLEESDFLDDPDVSSGKSSNERDSKKNAYRKVTEDDDLDIYSDIEVSSAGGQNCASEHEDNERSFDVLPPPPEPSALLIGLGEQDSSDSETNDSLVIDIRPNPDDHTPKDNATKSPDESEKYDPAVPCDDSDDDDDDDDDPVVSQNLQKDDIPLPPCPPSSDKIDMSTSNASYLQSPTYGELSKQCSVHVTEAVTEAVKEVISSTLQSSSASINKALASGDEDDDEGECPNFSIYSADSMDIARKATEIPEENSDALDKSDTVTTDRDKVEDGKCEAKTDILEMPVELSSDQNNQESRDDDEQMEETGSISEIQHESLENNEMIEQLSKTLHCSSRSSSSCSSSSSSCCSSSSSSSGSSSSSSTDGSSISQNTSCEEPNKDATPEDKNIKAVSVEQISDQLSKVSAVHTVVPGASENHEKSAISDENGTQNHEVIKVDESEEKENLVVEPVSAVPVVSSDNSTVTQNKTALSLDNTTPSLPAATPVGLEGLDTETISETEEAINFDDDMSHDETSLLSEEDGEICPQKKRKKVTDEVKDNEKVDSTVSVEKPQVEKDLSPAETVDYEEGEIVDERPRLTDVAQKDKILDKDKRHESSEIRSADEAEMSECSVHIGNEEEKKKKKKKSTDRDRAELSVNDDEDIVKGKGGTLDDSISWKKPSKGTKERNYRDSKSVKPAEKGKDGSRKENEDKELPKKDKKKKEKRKDMERYDVRKIVSDKKRKRKDEFGRDLSRDRSYSRSRSRSKSRGKSRDRSTSLSRSKTNRTKGRSSPRRSRHRSRSRSRSRSYRSRSRSKNKSLTKLKDRSRKSRSKERQRKTSRDRSRSRNRRSRSRSGSRLRNRSRSRSIHKSREGKDRSRAAVRQKRPPKNRRSWSRTWTPSWSRSRSRSRSVSCSSYSRSPSPSARRYNRSYSRSFSRSWSRERHERVPLMEKKTNTVSKPPKKLTVIVNNSKEDSERQRKKEKKKKDSRKSKDQSGAEKRKKRKERSPLPSKEVFTSGDNILVSVNFNKSNKGPGAKDAAVAAAAAVTSASICALPKDPSKRKQRGDDAFDVGRETTKKSRKDKSGKDKTSKGLNSNAANADKTQNRKSKKGTKADKRLAALLRQKPVAIIDLDQSPFREQTPSPRDLIVLSDSDEAQRDKETEMEDGIMTRMMHQEILSPQNSLKLSATARTPESQSPVMSSVSNYLNTSTGPKTPPEPQIKFSIAAKPQLRSISNPLREEDDDMMADDTVLDESDRQMDEDLDRDIMHKGPNTPPEPRGPTTPCSPPISPDAYDPFDPTKSGTPSPVREEVNIDELQSPSGTPCEEVLQHSVGVTDSPIQSDLDDTAKKTLEISSEIPLIQSSDNLRDDVTHSPDRTKSMIETMLGNSPSNIDESVVGASQHQLQVEVSPSEPGEKSSTLSVTMIVPMNSDITPLSPEIKIIPMTVQQQKLLKQNIVQQQPVTSTPTHCSTPSNYANLPTSIASTPISPLTSTPVSRSNVFNTPITITVPQLSSHHLPHHLPSSPVVSQQRGVGIKTVSEKVTSISYVKSTPQRPTGQQNGDQKEQIQDTSTEVVDMDLDSPYSPGSSEGDDLFEPPSEAVKPTAAYPPMNTRPSQTPQKNARQSLPAVGNTPNKPPDKFDALFGMSPARNKGSGKMGKIKTHHSKSGKMKKLKGSKKEIQIKMDEDQLQILDDLPSSAVELQVKDKFLKKLNRQERVVEEVKLALKPYYTSKKINKEEYKEILRRSVPKICHNRSGEINPKKISALVDAYVLKYRYLKKKQLSSQRKQSKPQKTTMWS